MIFIYTSIDFKQTGNIVGQRIAYQKLAFKIGGNNNEVFIVTDNSLHSTSVLAPRSHLIADLVMGRLITSTYLAAGKIFALNFCCVRRYFIAPPKQCLSRLAPVTILISF
ncbi:hypothetical protein LNO81_18455 [Klebsiella variicola subsp. variicola]|nr:hypothetical protein [Klebsiella variicola subsp. variicola]